MKLKNFVMAILAAVVSMSFVSSCSDDESMPDVTVKFKLIDCYRVGDLIYVVQGEDFGVESVRLVNNGNDRAVIGYVGYFWDNLRIGTASESPYTFVIDTDFVKPGQHLFQAQAEVYAVDYSPCMAYTNWYVNVVESADQIPAGAIQNPEVEANYSAGQSD